MATRTSKARHRAEASAPATSVAVAAARAQDSPPAPAAAAAAALRRSAAFPPRRGHQQHHSQHYPNASPQHPHLHLRCDSERIGSRQPRCGEVAGGTAAGCAAVCCCFPCVMVEVVVLATVRAPAALCRRAVKARRRAGGRRTASAGQAADMYELLVDGGGLGLGAEAGGDAAVVWPAVKPVDEAGDMEKEVWARFYEAGFWRSPSQLGDEIR
ncbi:uncharacterized protein LOC100823316 [Brachypodium distachyon]|uniref:Uncharacterized protein n=1 Tax=Brachypodium distachyon TaxID=15368 RepID=I1GPY4_BRADI|nr:uncharacterized protein LOC100823316 [Brachypodium distachyon]KQK13951.1 hypothetical protein BRADI_1g13560v3 [Brachypodium distachyon]|eukprot:XP_014751977.1 uncharacterized protein LOC100823316 [Brachypodium distachyon]